MRPFSEQRHVPDPEQRPRVVLGVTGSIAAYKAADLTSKLVQAGADVHVIMTENACRLVQPQTFLTLSRNRVTTGLWDIPDWRPEHIALSDSTDLFVIAPATANIIGKYANGIADDALSTFALSYAGPCVIAPGMNPRMWRHPAVEENCSRLRSRRVRIIDPEPGRVACGEERGPGRLAGVDSIFNAVRAHLAIVRFSQPAGQPKRILVTAGPTQEALDPVRYLTNRSSGKMGYAIAEAALAAGHEVVLISGPVNLSVPAGAQLVKVRSAAEMTEAVHTHFSACDVLFMAGAVADFRPREVAENKIKKVSGALPLEMVRTEDILGSLSARDRRQLVIGFAAETENLDAYAGAKLKSKQLDWIVANDVSRAEIGFGSEDNEVKLVGAEGAVVSLPRAAKIEIAAQILATVLT